MACEPTLSATAPPPTVRRVGGGLRPTRGARLVPTHPLLPSPTHRARPTLPTPALVYLGSELLLYHGGDGGLIESAGGLVTHGLELGGGGVDGRHSDVKLVGSNL